MIERKFTASGTKTSLPQPNKGFRLVEQKILQAEQQMLPGEFEAILILLETCQDLGIDSVIILLAKLIFALDKLINNFLPWDTLIKSFFQQAIDDHKITTEELTQMTSVLEKERLLKLKQIKEKAIKRLGAITQ